MLTGRERVLKALKREEVDRVPWVPFVGCHAGALLGISAEEYLSSEENIVRAMRLLWERMKIVVEPSGAVPLAAVLEHPDHFRDHRVGLIVSGGNVDLDHLPW